MLESNIPVIATKDSVARAHEHFVVAYIHKNKQGELNLLNIDHCADNWGDFLTFDEADYWANEVLTDDERKEASILLVTNAFWSMRDLVESHLQFVDKAFAFDSEKSIEQNLQPFDNFFNALASLDAESKELLINSLGQACYYAKIDPISEASVGRGIGFEYLCYVCEYLTVFSSEHLVYTPNADEMELLTFAQFIEKRIASLQSIIDNLD